MNAKAVKTTTDSNIALNIQPRDIALSVHPVLPAEKITAILSVIQREAADAVHSTPVIYITSAYNGEGAGLTALETALSAADTPNKKILLIDMAPNSKNKDLQKLRNETAVTLDNYAKGASTENPFSKIENASLVYAKLEKTQDLQNILDQLRALADLIIIASEDALASQSIENYAQITDGGILVIEAERTRTPVIQELKNRIENAGGKIIGTVLSNRKQHIPNFIYSLFFKR